MDFFPSQVFRVERSAGGWVVQANVQPISKVLHCKRRWIGRPAAEILYEELRWEDPEISLQQGKEVWLYRKSQKAGQGELILLDGDELRFNRLVQEPAVSIGEIPYLIAPTRDYRDPPFVTVFKPHGIATTPQGSFFRNNMHWIMRNQLGDEVLSTKQVYLKPVNRLDRCTAGVLIFARTPEASAKTIVKEKLYLAMVEPKGVVDINRLNGFVVNDRLAVQKHVPGQVLRTEISGDGVEALTEFSKLIPAIDGKGSYFVLCRPITGRTHQIRAHLSSVGLPIVGDICYSEAKFNGLSQPERINLLAWKYVVSIQDRDYEYNADKLPAWAFGVMFEELLDSMPSSYSSKGSQFSSL